MKYAILAAAFAAAVSIGAPAQAAPADLGGLKFETNKDGAIQKVWHCRRWSGGWGCGGGGGHWRWGSRRRWR